MRILILTTFFPPENSIASHRPYSWARYWSEQGHAVTVATTPKGSVERNFELIEVPMPVIVGAMKVHYQGAVANPPYWKKALLAPYHYLRHKRGILNACRMPDFTDLWVRPLVNRLAREKEWDCAVSTAGPYAVHIAAERLKKMGLVKHWAADFRDLWSDNHAYPGIFPFTAVEKWLEKRLLKNADLISTVSESWGQKLEDQHGNDKVVVIENGFEPEDLLKISSKPFFPLDGKVRIAHTGMVYPEKQTLPLFFEALAAFPQKRKFECCFAGPQLEGVEKLVSKYQLEGIVKTMGNLPRSEALAMQRDATALLFFPWNETTGSGRGLVSGKIYEYLYAQKPIFALSDGKQEVQAAEQLIKASRGGTILTSPSAVAEALKGLLEKRAYTTASSAFLEQYSRKALALKLLKHLEQFGVR